MPLLQTEVHIAIDAVTARAAYLALHTADPGTGGTSEAAGTGYARQALVWAAAASGAAPATQVSFTCPAATYSHFGVFSALTAGTFRGGGALTPPKTVDAGDTVRVTITITGSAT